MKNQVQNGDAIDIVASGTLTSGQGLLVGSMFGVVAKDAVLNDTVALWLKGVYTLTKVSAQAWTVGQIIYWDNGNARCTTVNGSNCSKIGVATAIAANPSATGNVRLNGTF